MYFDLGYSGMNIAQLFAFLKWPSKMTENTTFQQIKLVTSAIPRFFVIFTGELIYDIILMI